jgi:hypothetical protein
VTTKARLAIFVIILCLVITLVWSPSEAQTRVQRYFPETGHTVKGEFLNAYERVTNPLLLYGFPITESFDDPFYGTLQYFQKARFEYHPELPVGQQVQVSPLGEYLYQPGPSLPSGDDPNRCRRFPNGFQVCLAFLDFYDENGGEAVFGWPLSNFENYNGRISQYFQKARFEWHPEFPSGQRVVLGDLGSEYFYTIKENPRFLEPLKGSNIPSVVLNLRSRAFVQRPVTHLNDDQTIYVIVRDQNKSPIQGAVVFVTVRIPSGDVGRYILPATDSHGITSISFHFDSKAAGQAQVSVAVSYQNLSQETTTSFQVWW